MGNWALLPARVVDIAAAGCRRYGGVDCARLAPEGAPQVAGSGLAVCRGKKTALTYVRAEASAKAWTEDEVVYGAGGGSSSSQTN